MKRFKFTMDTGSVIDILARDFRGACEIFDLCGEDPRHIASIEER
jgi:hypothetical protein